MILNFKCKDTEKLFKDLFVKKFNSIERVARRKLIIPHRSKGLNDLKSPPSNRLEKLRGDRMEQYSLRINKQYRICFEWNENDAFNVEIVDYH